MADRIELRARANEFFAYSGRSLLVTDLNGEISGQEIEGFYFENTRLLCRAQAFTAGRPLKAIVASPVGGNGLLAYARVEPSGTTPEGAVFVESAYLLDEGMRLRFRVENYNHRPEIRLDLAVHLTADFADIIEAETGTREQTGAVETSWDEARRELRFRYCHPELDRAVAIRVDHAPGPVRREGDILVFPLTLPPHRPAVIDLAVEPIVDGRRWSAPTGTFGSVTTRLDRVRRELQDETPRLISTNATVARAWQTATADLASLPLGDQEGPAAPSAGLPLYQQFFGRDTLTIAWQALLAVPSMMRDTLRANAAYQGTRIDNWRDEEPGKLIHQSRRGPLSVLEKNPYTRYYGDYATPPDFLIMLGQYLSWTGDLATVRGLLPAARKAINWLNRYGDLDGDGFIEYVTRSRDGEKNQGWKDSWNAIVGEHGEVIANPIATSELQAYWYVGLQQAAMAFFLTGDVGYAIELLGNAAKLKRQFNRAFWMEDEGFYALALDPHKRQVRSIASNTGHLLAAGIVPKERARGVARRLMAPDMFSGWGVRTLSSAHPSYNPFSYHLGSVWPVENGTFALGFARYGCWDELDRLAEGFFALTDLFVENRLPEVVGGVPRDADHPHPGIYPDSNEPQGWSDSAVVIVVQSLLGMHPLAPLGLLTVDPHLPPWLPDLRLEGVRVGASRLDLEFHRQQDGTTRYRVTRREGRVRVIRQPAPDAPGVSLTARALAAARSLLHLG